MRPLGARPGGSRRRHLCRGRWAVPVYRLRLVHTATSIHIRAPREAVFALVHDLVRWPELLPHYRYVTTLRHEGRREVVKMACTRSGIPVAWVSAYEADETALEMRFEHLQAWTKGMKVVWLLTPTTEGTRVEIVHDLHFRVPALAWLAEPIIGGFFIEHVATQTLRTFKKLLEGANPNGAPTT